MPWLAQGGSRVIAPLIDNLGARWGWWSAPRPDRFTPGNDPVHIVEEAGWAPGPVWKGVEKRKSLVRPGFKPRTVQPVASRYAEEYTAVIFCREVYLEDGGRTFLRNVGTHLQATQCDDLEQWYSTWGTRTPRGTRRHLRGYVK
jgi:hypothetical protein